MKRRVVYSPEAREDLNNLFDYIAERTSADAALAYTLRIKSWCDSLADFAERGTQRDDLWPGLRIIGFEKRVAVAFHVTADTVTIDRILYGGRDLSRAFSKARVPGG